MAVGVAVPAPPPLMEGVFWQQEDLGRRMFSVISDIYSWTNSNSSNRSNSSNSSNNNNGERKKYGMLDRSPEV